MFSRIRFGDGEEKIVNPNCSEMNLLIYIADFLFWDGEGSLVLSDVKGNLKVLGGHPFDNALNILNINETYVPIVIRKTTVHGIACNEHIILLSATDKVYGPIKESLTAREASARKTRPQLSISPTPDACMASKLNLTGIKGKKKLG